MASKDSWVKIMDNSSKVDVRIIVSNLNISEVISKAIINANLESYNVIVSSIIPTNDLEIAEGVLKYYSKEQFSE